VLVNPRLSMNFRLALSSFFLGILTAFMVWSAHWVLESRREVTFDMPGEVTVLRMFERPERPQIVAAADAVSAQEELKAYLRDRSLALIISSYGEGLPEMLVYDPGGLLSWFPRPTPEESGSATSGAYLFKGTYTERRWAKTTTTPLLPRGIVVEGVIAAPRGAGNLQYARQIGQDSLPPGNYTINTVDSSQVGHVLDFLDRMGLAPQGARRIPLIQYFVLNPLLVVTVLFLVLGHVCTVLSWSLYLRGRAHEFGIRSRHGAHPSALVRENLVGGLPGLVTGSVVGVILSGLLVAAIGHVQLTSGNFQTLAGAGVVAAAVATVTWSTILHVVIRSCPEVRILA